MYSQFMKDYECESANNAGCCINLLSEDHRDLVTENVTDHTSKSSCHGSQGYADNGIEVVLNSYFNSRNRKYSETYCVEKKQGFLQVIKFISKDDRNYCDHPYKVDVNNILHPGHRGTAYEDISYRSAANGSYKSYDKDPEEIQPSVHCCQGT